MQSSLIGKIDKARRYSEERHRVSIQELTASFRGENNNHNVTHSGGKWNCNCDFFSSHTICSHTIALQRILQEMLPGDLTSPGNTPE